MSLKRNPVEILRNILRQEHEEGYVDKVVIGGLDEFLARHSTALSLISHELNLSYAALDQPQRVSWVARIVARLDGLQITEDKTSLPAKFTENLTFSPTPSLTDPVSKLGGVSKRVQTLLEKLGITVISDLIYHFPRRYIDYKNVRRISELQAGVEQTAVLEIWESSVSGTNVGRGRGRGRGSTQAVLADETGTARAIWYNQPWVAKYLKPGTKVVLSGRVGVFKGRISFENPEYEPFQIGGEYIYAARLVPVYPATSGLFQRTLRALVKRGMMACLPQVEEFISDDLKHRTGLLGLQEAISQYHYPDTQSSITAARRRLAFDELFLLQMAFLQRKNEWQEEGNGWPIPKRIEVIEGFLSSLSFSPTSAQRRVILEILDDTGKDRAMHRLLQGDVGSGKTVVATAALLNAAVSGAQSALMAPTEILAEQHFITITELLAGERPQVLGGHLVRVNINGYPGVISIAVIMGSTPAKIKKELQRLLRDGDIDIIIGTHALIQESIEIPKLALVVVDEQQRFGVLQRSALREKGVRPHILAMSATPIPRSLALTLYGDLDVSIIDEMPPGRDKIKTRWVEPDNRMAVYEFIREEVKNGFQAFIVCPLVDESEFIETRAATEEFDRLSREIFPDLHLGLLHGRMSLKDKEDTMGLFRSRVIDILVCTPVVEVGVDVPNATVMVIDGSDRFGLAQLHQFRGRVGRGDNQSHCILMADSPGPDALERLKIMERVSDGFQLADEDLKIRGPGDYLGTRQSGIANLRIARITDQDILALARKEANALLEIDRNLGRAENVRLRKILEIYSRDLVGELS